MGSRANYAITENGRAELFYSHWGAQRVDRDFFFGPDVALTVIRATRPEPFDQIMNDVWCEGGALVDIDRKRLLVWGGEDIPLRRSAAAVLAGVGANWVGRLER